MPKYRIYGAVTGSKYLGTVEADNEAQAKEKGEQLDECYIGLCHQCADECEDPEVTVVHVELADEDDEEEE